MQTSADGSLAANVSETLACSLQAPEHHVHCTQCIYGHVNWLEAGSGRLAAAQGLDAAQLSLRVFIELPTAIAKGALVPAGCSSRTA